MLQNLKTKAEGYATDYKLQVWIEIDSLVNGNISDFLEVTNPATLIALLQEIQTGAAAIDNTSPDIQNLVKQLQASTTETIGRVQTAQ